MRTRILYIVLLMFTYAYSLHKYLFLTTLPKGKRGFRFCLLKRPQFYNSFKFLRQRLYRYRYRRHQSIFRQKCSCSCFENLEDQLWMHRSVLLVTRSTKKKKLCEKESEYFCLLLYVSTHLGLLYYRNINF